VLYQIVIPVLVFLSVTGLGGALLTRSQARRRALQARLQTTGDLTSTAFVPEEPMLPRILQRIGKHFSPSLPTTTLPQELARAGYHSSSAVPIFIGAKVLLLLIGLIGGTLLALTLQTAWTTGVLLVAILASFLSFTPNLVVSVRRSARREEVRRHLPDAIDLLEICVSAGMGLEMAWNCVADEVRHVCPILADEMALANLETHLGTANAIAMRHMAERTRVQELASLTAALLQSERFGTSISEALRVFASTLREERSHRAQEAAEKLAVKLIFPMVLFVFPPVVVVMAGPAFIQMAAALSGR
jgi:tight adherence protein C